MECKTKVNSLYLLFANKIPSLILSEAFAWFLHPTVWLWLTFVIPREVSYCKALYGFSIIFDIKKWGKATEEMDACFISDNELLKFNGRKIFRLTDRWTHWKLLSIMFKYPLQFRVVKTQVFFVMFIFASTWKTINLFINLMFVVLTWPNHRN